MSLSSDKTEDSENPILLSIDTAKKAMSESGGKVSDVGADIQSGLSKFSDDAQTSLNSGFSNLSNMFSFGKSEPSTAMSTVTKITKDSETTPITSSEKERIPLYKTDFLAKGKGVLSKATSFWTPSSDNRLVLKVVLVLLLLAFLGFNVLVYLGYSFDKFIQIIKNLFRSLFRFPKKDEEPPEEEEEEETEHEKSPPPNTIKDMEHKIESPDPHKPPPPVVPDQAPTNVHMSGKSGFCNVGSWKGVRSCVWVNNQEECMSGDIFPTKEICINPNLRAG